MILTGLWNMKTLTAILNFAFLTPDSDSAPQKTYRGKIMFNLQKIKILAAILDPLY